jgi:hypothetical protein
MKPQMDFRVRDCRFRKGNCACKAKPKIFEPFGSSKYQYCMLHPSKKSKSCGLFEPKVKSN